MSSPAILTLKDDVALITMDDGKANAFGTTMIEALDGCFDEAEAKAKAIVLAGRTGVFSAGFDLKVMGQGPEAAAVMVKAGASFLLRMYLHPQPIVAAATGHGIAAGALLLCSADYRIGAEGDFKLGLNETSIGMALPPFGVEIARDRIPVTHHAEAFLGATLYGPKDAAHVGYLDETRPADVCVSTAVEKAQSLTALNLEAYAATKINLRQATKARIQAHAADMNFIKT